MTDRLSDIEILERIGEIRESQARTETILRQLTDNLPRCNDHATRLRSTEANIAQLWTVFKVAGTITGLLLTAVGVVAAFV